MADYSWDYGPPATPEELRAARAARELRIERAGKFALKLRARGVLPDLPLIQITSMALRISESEVHIGIHRSGAKIDTFNLTKPVASRVYAGVLLLDPYEDPYAIIGLHAYWQATRSEEVRDLIDTYGADVEDAEE